MMVRRLFPLSLVSLLASSLVFAAPPTPASHFGHEMNADRKLLDWDKVVGYFRALEAGADGRVKVEEIGSSTEGRPLIAAFIASASTISNLDRYREIQQLLADPRKTPPDAAARLIPEGKVVVMITCSIHSTEVASTSSGIEFAYRLLTQQDKPKLKAILDNTIFILVPSLNPDGVDIVTRWYRKTLDTPFEGTSPPELYQKYVGHDNNRDWYIFSQPETRHVISQLHNVWHPQIVYDVHQQGATSSRMFVPPWLDPVDPNIDPLIAQMCNAIGAGMAADLTSAGRKGIAINAMYDFWTPARHYQAYHGGLRILSESASARLATPIEVKPEDIGQNALGYSPRERSWNHLEPWPGGKWTVAEIMTDQLIAMESLLWQAAIRREDFLRNFYRIHERAVTRTSPSAFLLPPEQEDPGSARKLLDTLRFGQVEIERATKPFRIGARDYPEGTYVIRMQQPYSAFAKTLLERQRYPDLRQYPGGPPKRPYDVTAQTLPLLMGVQVDTLETPFSTALEPATSWEFRRPGPPLREGQLSAFDISSWRQVNVLWRTGVEVHRSTANGDFYIRGNPPLDSRRLRQPRIGLYKSHAPSMDEGWTRWLLEQFGFAYTSVKNADIQAGKLKDRFDVMVFPAQRANTIREGYRAGSMPPEYTGGVGKEGEEALREFARQGGTVIFLNESVDYALEVFQLPARNALQGLSTRDFYSPGSLLNVTLKQGHPLTWGLPENIAIWSEQSPALDLPADARGFRIAQYPAANVLASGWLLGDKFLHGKSALLDLPVGQGRVILFGMRPQYRAQSYQAFKLFFNSLLYFE